MLSKEQVEFMHNGHHQVCPYISSYKTGTIYVICGVDRIIIYVSIDTVNLRNHPLVKKFFLFILLIDFLQ